MDDRDTKPQRELPFSYRAPAGRRGEVVAWLKARGTTFNAEVNALFFGPDTPKPRRILRDDASAAADLLAASQRMNDMCNVIREKGTGGHTEALLEACHEELVEIRGLILALHGRRP